MNLSNAVLSLFKVQDHVGERLKQARSRLGLTQQALADRGGISRMTQVSYESGNGADLSTDYLRAVQDTGIDVPYVLFGHGGEDILKAGGAAYGINWPLLQQVHEDVEYFCLRAAPKCPASYRWKLAREIYEIMVKNQRGESEPDISAIDAQSLVEKVWESHGER